MMSKNPLLQTMMTLSPNKNLIVVNKALVDFTGSLEAGIMLSQLLYWTPRSSNDGWIAKSDAEFAEELCLSRYSVREAREKLIDMGIVEVAKAQFNGAPTTHYRISEDRLTECWLEFLDRPIVRNQTVDYSKSYNRLSENEQSLTETTSEITSENLRENFSKNNSVDDATADAIKAIEEVAVKYPPSNKALVFRRGTPDAIKEGIAQDFALKEEWEKNIRTTPNWEIGVGRKLLRWLKEKPPEQTVSEFAYWWYNSDWRGKQGQPPTIYQVMELWPQAFLTPQIDPRNIPTIEY